MRLWRTTMHENGSRPHSYSKIFVFNAAKSIFVAETCLNLPRDVRRFKLIGRGGSLGTDARESTSSCRPWEYAGFYLRIVLPRRCRAKPEVILRVRVENFADFAGKGVQFKRFFEVVVAMFGNATANGGIVGVTGHEENRSSRTGEFQSLGHLPAAHDRHDDIANYEMNWALMRLGFRQALDAIRGRDNGKAGDAEIIGDEFPQTGLVFNQ